MVRDFHPLRNECGLDISVANCFEGALADCLTESLERITVGFWRFTETPPPDQPVFIALDDGDIAFPSLPPDARGYDDEASYFFPGPSGPLWPERWDQARCDWDQSPLVFRHFIWLSRRATNCHMRFQWLLAHELQHLGREILVPGSNAAAGFVVDFHCGPYYALPWEIDAEWAALRTLRASHPDSKAVDEWAAARWAKMPGVPKLSIDRMEEMSKYDPLPDLSGQLRLLYQRFSSDPSHSKLAVKARDLLDNLGQTADGSCLC